MTEYMIDGVYVGNFIDLCNHFGVYPDSVNSAYDLMNIVHERNGTNYSGHGVVSYNPDREPEYEVYWF